MNEETTNPTDDQATPVAPVVTDDEAMDKEVAEEAAEEVAETPITAEAVEEVKPEEEV